MFQNHYRIGNKKCSHLHFTLEETRMQTGSGTTPENSEINVHFI